MIKETPEGLILKIKIVPNSSKNDIILEQDFIKIKITAQPIENKANKMLIEFLSKTFKVPKTNIEIVKGETSKEKTLFFKINENEKRNDIISRLTK
ncbi:MAG: YggU family protein [Cyanobacteria bacterium SIG28]|nr:YggU family protein [Cyanobacteria bacterium SIG28]